MKITKRNGEVVTFDKSKIQQAIEKSMKAISYIDTDKARLIAHQAEEHFKNADELASIYKIEEFVYNALIDNNLKEVARAYESYRAIREHRRINNTTDDSILSLIERRNEEVSSDNSNKDSKLAATQRDLIAGIISKDIAKRKLIPAHIIEAHENGVLYYHDMDFAMNKVFNCCLINIEDMFKNGTVISGKLIEEPKSFTVACTLLIQIISQISVNQFGGCSVTIKHLAPYLRKSYNKYYENYIKDFNEETAKKLAEDRMLEDLKAGVQTIRYQLNTVFSLSGQSPFATIYLEIEEGSKYEREMALICEEMIRQRLEGMKNENGQEIAEAFPKLVYLLDTHNCLEGGKYDYITELSAKCNAKRLVPDYQSAKIMRQNYNGGTFPPMGCRSHLSEYIDKNGEQKWYGRFNAGVISLNLPQIALTSKGDMDLFWKIFDQRLELCKEAIMVRRNLLKGTKASTSPIHWMYGGISRLKADDTIDHLLENGYSTASLGYVGLCECVYALIGKSHTTKEGEKLALEIMHKMKNTVDKWKEETKIGFGLYGTPGETLTSTFCRIDKEKFGIIPNVTDRMYYTNSYHVHVAEEIDAFEKLKFESQFHEISLGGCISYIEARDLQNNIEAIKQVINYIYHNVQYAEINVKSDVCYKCAYTGEIKTDENLEWYCPNCNNRDQSQMQVMRRTCGYIGSSFWSKGRTAEIAERVLHL